MNDELLRLAAMLESQLETTALYGKRLPDSIKRIMRAEGFHITADHGGMVEFGRKKADGALFGVRIQFTNPNLHGERDEIKLHWNAMWPIMRGEWPIGVSSREVKRSLRLDRIFGR